MSGLGFNIPLSADPTQLKKDLDAAVAAARNGGAAMGESVDRVSAKYKYLEKLLEIQLAKTSQLAKKYGEASVEALRSAAAAATLKERLEKLNNAGQASIGVMNGQRGSYNALGNSVNQLSREMPAFANSVNTGFMAISNNLPILFDAVAQIKAANAVLIAQGQPVKSVLSQVGAAVFSYGTALSAGVTLLTLYGGKLVENISHWGETKSVVSDATQYYATFNAVIIKGTEAINDQINAIGKRNRLLGVKLGSAMLNQTDEQTTLAIEYNRLSAKNRVWQDMQDQHDWDVENNMFFPSAITSQALGMTGDIAQQGAYAKQLKEADQKRIDAYEKQVVAQRDLVMGLQKELALIEAIAQAKRPKFKETTMPGLIDNLSSEHTSKGINLQTAKYLWRDEMKRRDGLRSIDVADVKFIGWEEAKKKSLRIGEQIGQAFSSALRNALISGLSTVGEAIGTALSGGDVGKTFFEGMIGTVTAFMQALGTAMIASAAASDQWQKWLLINPGTALAAGIGLVAAAGVVKGLMSGGIGGNGSSSGSNSPRGSWDDSGNLPMMADGGLLYGRTAFVGGEYPGAASNPEVVAPLNRLRDIIGSGSPAGSLSASLTGRNIQLSLKRQSKFNRLNYGR